MLQVQLTTPNPFNGVMPHSQLTGIMSRGVLQSQSQASDPATRLDSTHGNLSHFDWSPESIWAMSKP